ncbi:MAG: DUF4132 domain-containing protein [Lachnospiraceae bacterium]|nr:DUF4132 domain-containing protein [Lachnospiraceae bacterium]
MAEFTYQTRRKLSETWVADMKERGKHLSEREKTMLPDLYYYSMPQDTCKTMRQLLQNGTYKTLSELYKNLFQNLVDVCVARELQGEFYYALDEMNRYQMTAGWFRRSLRSDSYAPFVEQSIRLLRAYARLDLYGGDLADVLTGNVTPELYDHARNEHFDYAGILAAQIDRGAEKTVNAIKDILFGENNTAMMSRELILGIVMSRDKSLYEDLGRFLLAARLQEGARQSVCETMDAGRPEAFLHLFSVIEENDLIRYSSVKRAVSTWIGIFNEKSVDRISDKLLRLMGQCLRDEDFLKEQLATDDAVAISCALWAKGFYDAGDAVETVLALVKNGTKQQKMTASYFCLSLQDMNLRMRASKEVLLTYPEDLELIACFMPGFMTTAGSCFYQLAKDENQSSYNVRNDKVRKPKPMAAAEMFENEAEAEKFYGILKELMPRIPKKGLLLSPCIFPWHQVEMSQSAIAVRLCLIAWMLQKDALLDEAAEMIPLIGQGERSYYYGASRAAVARVLLYRPTSETRKKVLFELLHNSEEYTNQAAHLLVEDMTLSAEDYLEIEKNLKYKKGRAQTLALLRKQDNKNLTACITRLLSTKSEECHMGALDLAMQLKKEDEKTFAQIVPSLQAFPEPTGKEQVLLKELLGSESEAQDILNTPGYGLYDVNKDWILPPANVDENEATKLFVHGEAACIRVFQQLDKLVHENHERSYTTTMNEEILLGNGFRRSRWTYNDPEATPLDGYPFRELWEAFYEKEIKTPELMMEVELYRLCLEQRNFYEQNVKLYQKVFGHGILKKAPFSNLVIALTYDAQVRTILSTLFQQYVPRSLTVRFGLCGIARLLSVLDASNDLFTIQEKRWNGTLDTYTKRATALPIFAQMCQWLSTAGKEDWETSFTLRFQLQQYYLEQKSREKQSQFRYVYDRSGENYLCLSDYVQCYVRGIWDKTLFYKAVFSFLNIGMILEPVSAVEQKGTVTSRNARVQGLNAFFGPSVIKPVDGKYRFDTIGPEMPEMTFAHELYKEVLPVVLKVELKRGEQPTPFSQDIKSIQVIYGIDYMIQILTALGKDPLQRGYSYYTSNTDRKLVLSHLLKVSRPAPDETAEDLKKALKGTDITKKRLVELAMYAQQWIPMIEEYLGLPGFASTCYYFMAHTSERFDEQVTSTIAKYTPLSPEELRDGAFDIHWFFEAYEKLGEKNFKLLYDAAKYSSTGTAHARARKYADAALGNVEKDALKTEIDAKRNKDLLMSIALLPLPDTKDAREEELLDRYQFIQKYKKESRQFGAQRRASEGRAVEIALRNLSVNAGFTDVTRLTLRMEGKLTEQSAEYFDWQPVDEIELMISVDENGKSTLICRKGGKALKSVPAKYKKHETVLKFQEVTKKLKEQYSRTKQMMEQAMEDRTSFEVWEFLELFKNPVARPITEPLVVKTTGEQDAKLGFLTNDGLLNAAGTLLPVKPDEKIFIAHPFDLYQDGHWHEYQKLLFEKQLKQPFKQIFRELYVKLEEELEKDKSMLFSGNQIQPQKTVGTLRSRRWVADYDDGLQKIYYKENIVARIYAMADWFSPSDAEAPTLEYVVFADRKTGKQLPIKDIPDIIYSEVMRDVDLAVSVAHAGGVDPETSHSTIEMRKAIVECNLSLFKTKNVRLEGNHAVIDGKLGQYTIHLGSGVVHQMGNAMLFVVPVHSQHRGRIFLPFVDDDPKTAEIMSKILLFAEDSKIKDPNILRQIQ